VSEGGGPGPGVSGADRAAAAARIVRTHLRRNVAAQVLHGMLGQTGFRLVNAPTLLPRFVHALSGSEVAVGLARSLQALGTVVSPVLGASLAGHRERVLGLGLAAGALMRVQILGLALAGLLLPAPAALVAVCVFMALMGFFQGLQMVLLNTLRGKVIPVERRGLVSGMRNLLAGAASAAVAWYVAGPFVEANVLGNGYAAVLLVAFAFAAFGLGALALTREPEAASVRRQAGVGAHLREMPALLRADRDFRAFFVARTLGAFGRMALPFYVLYAATRTEVTGALIGGLTSVWLLTSAGVTVVWGALADRTGYRLVMGLALALWLGSQGVLMAAPGEPLLLAAFVGAAAGMGGFALAAQNMVLELGRAEDAPIRIAVSNTAANLIGAIGPVVGGVIVDLVSYEALFGTTVALQSLALTTVVLLVREPRRLARDGRVIDDSVEEAGD